MALLAFCHLPCSVQATFTGASLGNGRRLGVRWKESTGASVVIPEMTGFQVENMDIFFCSLVFVYFAVFGTIAICTRLDADVMDIGTSADEQRSPYLRLRNEEGRRVCARYCYGRATVRGRTALMTE